MAKKQKITISAKDLGAMALEDFCPRCFWIKRKSKLPWQIFPGIFTAIDGYVKNIVHSHIDFHKRAPQWLPNNASIIGWKKAPHWSKFSMEHAGVITRGTPDDILVTKDGLHDIPDYKTARFPTPEKQDKLLPMYEIQLSVYHMIDNRIGHRVRQIYLAYCDPDTSLFGNASVFSGFEMYFDVKTIPVECKSQRVFELMEQAKDIVMSPIPAGYSGCKDCAALDGIVDLVVEWDDLPGPIKKCQY